MEKRQRARHSHTGFWNLLQFSLAIGFLSILMIWVYGYQAIVYRAHLTEPVTFEVSSGMRFGQVIDALVAEELVIRPKALAIYGRLTGLDARIKAGEYQFESGVSVREMIDQMAQGVVVEYLVTLVEGLTFKQWLAQLHQQPKIKQTLSLDNPQNIEQWFAQLVETTGGLDESSIGLVPQQLMPEGWFFPDTYRYPAQATDVSVLERAYREMYAVLTTEWANRSEGLPYKNAYEALIMASIIEKETGVAEERPKIASVFINRLHQRMRLQTDPTVIYGLGDAFDGNITRAHLRQKTAYNTYVIHGLPPTPISMVSHAALQAALHPDGDDVLYFVSKGDGSHQFSHTLEEHNRAVRRYQLKR